MSQEDYKVFNSIIKDTEIGSILSQEVDSQGLMMYLNRFNDILEKQNPSVNVSLLFVDQSKVPYVQLLIFRSSKFSGFKDKIYDDVFYNVKIFHDTSLQGQLLKTKEPIFVQDFDTMDKSLFSKADLDQYLNHGFKSVLLIPFVENNEVFAYINVYTLDVEITFPDNQHTIQQLFQVNDFVKSYFFQFFSNWRYDSMLLRYNELLLQITDLFLSLKSDGTIIYVNREVLNLFNCQYRDIVEKNINEIFPDLVDLLAETRELKEQHQIFKKIDGEFFYTNAENREFVFETMVWPSSSPYEQNLFHVIAKDVTAKKEYEKELFKAQRTESIGILAGGLAHDLNNHLTVINGNVSFLDYLLEHPSNFKVSEARESLTSILETSRTINSLTKQLLTFSKGGSPILSVVDLVTLVRETGVLFTSGSNVKPEFQFELEEAFVKVDKGMISQALSNLILNGLHAIQDKDKPRLKLIVSSSYSYKDEPGWKKKTIAHENAFFVHVEDNGSGIDPSNLENVLDPFFTTKTDGDGLGLSTSHSVIVKHSGKLLIDSTEGSGTIVSLMLPKTTEQPEEAISIPVKMELSKHILILDDNVEIQKILMKALKKDHTIECFLEGETLLVRLEKLVNDKKPPDLLLLDLTIAGGLGGKETFEKAKQLSINIPAIVMSGYTEEETLSNYRSYGFKGRLVKPFSIHELFDQINLAISHPDV